MLVPDTNALIFSPAFQDWKFDEFSKFELVLVPALLSELDDIKNGHRNPDVRQKAQDIFDRSKSTGF